MRAATTLPHDRSLPYCPRPPDARVPPTALAAALTSGIIARLVHAEEETDSARAVRMFNSIKRDTIGSTGKLGDVGTLTVPDGCRFTESAGAPLPRTSPFARFQRQTPRRQNRSCGVTLKMLVYWQVQIH